MRGAIWPRGSTQSCSWDPTGLPTNAICKFVLATVNGVVAPWSASVPCSRGIVPVVLPNAINPGQWQVVGLVPAVDGTVANVVSDVVNVV